MHSEAFLDDSVDINKLLAIAEVRKSLRPNDLVNLCLRAFLRLGVTSK